MKMLPKAGSLSFTPFWGVRWRRFSGCVHNVHYVGVADSVGFA